MSKEPLEKDEVEGQKTKFFTKGFFIGFAISCVIQSGLGVLIYLLEKDGDLGPKLALCDTFAIPGFLTILLWLLTWVSAEGAFDALSYGIKLAFYTTFYKNIRETKIPKTYAEYRELKRAEKKQCAWYMLIAGVLFFLIGMLFLIIFHY